jgi:catalase (peroxidase I)
VPTTNDRTVSVSLIIVQGGTARIPNAVQIGGAAQTIEWYGGTAPTGNANQIDVVSFTLIRAGSAWTVLGSLSTYA